ncbi:MAG: hypothetical protein ACLS9K_11615 [Lachnospira eligens]
MVNDKLLNLMMLKETLLKSSLQQDVYGCDVKDTVKKEEARKCLNT